MKSKRPCKYNIQNVESITCPYCGQNGFKILHWGHLRKIHNKTIQDVNKEYPDIPTMTQAESDKKSKARLKCDEQITETCNKKYGGVGYKSEDLKEKTIKTLKKKYNVDNIMKIESIKKKFRGQDGNCSKKNNPKRAQKISQSLKGKPSKLKGRSYSEIHGKEKTKELIEKRRISGAVACSKVENPSIPQLKLYNLIKEFYPEAVLNYPISWYNVDIAIIYQKIAIEYDGSYWHQNKKSDIERQQSLEELGWKFLRYVDKVPSEQELLHDIRNLITI